MEFITSRLRNNLPGMIEGADSLANVAGQNNQSSAPQTVNHARTAEQCIVSISVLRIAYRLHFLNTMQPLDIIVLSVFSIRQLDHLSLQ